MATGNVDSDDTMTRKPAAPKGPTKDEAFKAGLTPKSAGARKEEVTEEERPETPAPKPEPKVDAATQIAEERKDMDFGPIPAFGIPVAEDGEELWGMGIVSGVREKDEADKAFNKRLDEAQNTIVAQALRVLQGPGGVKAEAYRVTRDENAGAVRISLLSTSGIATPPSGGGRRNDKGEW